MDLVSPHPFWPIQNGLLSVFPSLKENLTCDVLVLGAGITGAFIAEGLVREGMDIVVVDKRDVTSGSTSASTALLQYEIDVPLHELVEQIGREDAESAYRLCSESIDLIEARVRDLGIEGVFEKKKSVYLASRAKDTRMLQRELAARQAAGLDVAYLDADDISARFSFRREAALLTEQAAEVDCYQLANKLLQTAADLGARIFDRTSIEKFDTEETGMRLTTDRGVTIQAKHVVFATGYESQDYLPHRVVTLKSSYALASEPIEQFSGWWERCLIWETARPYLYLRTTADGRALIGGEDDPFRNPKARDYRVDKKTARLEKKFTGLFPDIDLEVAYRWGGTFGETKDGLAYIGAVRQMPHCQFALGFGGNGITYSAIATGLIRDAILGKANSQAHLFRFDR